jgi:cytochrome c-type biogenesis protein CcmH
MVKQRDEIEAEREPYPGEYQHGWGVVAAMALLMALALVIMGRGVVLAQADAPATTSEVTADEVNAVARQLWCPLCSGVRLDACELKACDQMKDVIAIKLSEGEDTESIKAYFVEQYGPQVMGEPPRSGFNWLAWILPAVAVVAGGYFFWRTTQRMVQGQPSTEPSRTNTVVSRGASRGLMAESPGSPTGQVPVAQPTLGDTADRGAGEQDEYEQKLEEELAKYG